MKITLETKHGVLQCKLDGRILDKLREMPGRTKWKDRDLVFDPTAMNINYLKEVFPDAVWDDRAKRLLGLDALAELEAESTRIKKLPPEATAFPFKTTPRDHQLKAFTWARHREYFAYFMEMGTGKSKTLIDVIASKWSSGEIDCFLLLAPNGVHAQWLGEQIPLHMPVLVQYIGHTHRPTRKAPEELFEPTHKLRILCLNIEAMSHDSGVRLATRFAASGRCFTAVDESTVIKTPGSKRSKATRKIGLQSAGRAILSGAPITRGIEDIYGQFLFLHEDALGFSSFYTFRNRYCDVVPAYHGAPHGVVRVTGHRNMEEFTKKVDAHSFRVTKEECLDLPPKVYLERHVELTLQQKRIYKEITQDLYAQLEDRLITMDSAIEQILRLQQVVCGHLPNEEGNGYAVLDSNRVKDMLHWLDECGDKVVIWARFIADIDLICKALGGHNHEFVRYDGQVKQGLRDANRDRWLNDPKCRVMVANPAAAARGQNWQIAQDVGYYSNSFDADHRWQSEDRTHRDGMKGTCTYTDFIAPGIDRKILAALLGKKNVADAVLDDPKSWLET